MPFKPGSSGNAKGRPKGSANKISDKLRKTITAFLSDNFKKITEDFHQLPARDRAKLYCDLLQYGLPKMQAVSMELGFERLSDEDLSEIIHQLIQQQNER